MAALSSTTKIILLAVSVLFLYGIWTLSSILFPFLLAIAIAYLLDPAVKSLSTMSRGILTRPRASLLMLLLFFSTILIIAGTTIPLLVEEMLMIASSLPDTVNTTWMTITEKLDGYGLNISMIDQDAITNMIKSTLTPGLRSGAEILSNIISNGSAAMTTVLMIFLVPLLAFYMTTEWPHITKTIDDLIPRPVQKTVRDLITQIDARVSGFVRGQIIVCTMIAIYYTVALLFAGLPYAFFVGIFTGLSILVPYIGTILSLGLALIIAAFQVSEMGWGIMGAVAAIYAAGQLVEGNFITPKIVGDRVGLHPVVIIFALMVGGYASGIFGMMIAIPIAAAIAVLIEFAVSHYKSSTLYNGCHPREGGDPVIKG